MCTSCATTLTVAYTLEKCRAGAESVYFVYRNPDRKCGPKPLPGVMDTSDWLLFRAHRLLMESK